MTVTNHDMPCGMSQRLQGEAGAHTGVGRREEAQAGQASQDGLWEDHAPRKETLPCSGFSGLLETRCFSWQIPSMTRESLSMVLARRPRGSSDREGPDVPEAGGHEGPRTRVGPTLTPTEPGRTLAQWGGMVDASRRLEDMPAGEAKAVAPTGHACGCS